MRESWDTLLNETQSLKEQLESLLEMVPQSAKFHKKTQEINKVWKRLQRAVNDVDQFITPVKSVKVTSPLLEDAEFKTTWQLWKEYLNEQHGIVMRSRAELMGLKRLAEISESKPDVAVKYLEFAISRPTDKNFYKVNELETKTETAEKPTGKTIIKLPPGYQKPPEQKPPPATPAPNAERSVSSPHGGEVSSDQRDGGVRQKTIEEEIIEFKHSKRNK